MGAADAWSGYWQADRLHSCIAAASADDQRELTTFWSEFALALAPDARVLDLGTGNGAVPLQLLAAQPGLRITAVDKAAIDPQQHVKSEPLLARVRFLGGVDMSQPLRLGQRFDAVTSQFGIEYAGLDAAARVLPEVLDDGGRFQWLLHEDGSAVVAPMAANAEELERLLAAGGILETLMRLAAGRATAEALRQEIRAYLQGPARRTKRISGQILAAAEQLMRLAARGPIHTPAASLLSRVRAERERLRQLEAAALDEARLAELAERIERSGVELSRRESLALGADRDDPAIVGWVLAGRRV